MDPELLIISGCLIVVALIGLLIRSRFLIRLAGGSLAIAILWKIAEIRGWLVDSKAVIIMYITASLFGFILSLIINPPSISLKSRRT